MISPTEKFDMPTTPKDDEPMNFNLDLNFKLAGFPGDGSFDVGLPDFGVASNGTDFDMFATTSSAIAPPSTVHAAPGNENNNTAFATSASPFEKAFRFSPEPSVAPSLCRTSSSSTASSSPAMDTLSPLELNLSPSLTSNQLLPELDTSMTSAPSPVVSSTPAAPAAAPAAEKQPVGKTGKPKKKFTGTRNTSIPPVSVDAPTVSRNYVLPSATSRKETPRSAARNNNKRSFDSSNGPQDDQSNLDEEQVRAIEAKRRQNTVAARISRQRKAEHLKNLENEVARLQSIEQEMLEWKKRAEIAEAKLHAM